MMGRSWKCFGAMVPPGHNCTSTKNQKNRFPPFPKSAVQTRMATGWREGLLAILLLGVLAVVSSGRTIAQTGGPQPVLVLNTQWNLAFAKGACESSAIWYKSVGKQIEGIGCDNFPACPDMMATAKACRSSSAAAALRDFEQKIIGSLVADAACARVTVVRYMGDGDPAYDSFAKLHDPQSFWNLSVNFHPGLAKQPWELKRQATTTSGKDDAQAIAGQVCSQILSTGAKAN
jgi:hypothetical protein